MKYFFLILNLSFLIPLSYSQDLKYAHKIIDTLCSPSMHGRGYVKDGDKIAANYLAEQFKSFKLESFRLNGSEADYYQNFSLDVNTFPGKMEVSVGDKELIAGKDFIVDAGSIGTSKEYAIGPSKKNSAVYAFINYNDAKTVPGCKTCLTVLIEKNKLTGDIATNTKQNPTIHILLNSFDSLAREINVKIENKFIRDYSTQNIIGFFKGSIYPDSFIVFSAHYDHLGQMGSQVYFPGANDNASGCAMLLNLAKYYSEHPPKYSIAFIAFGAEEAGLVGSKYYVEHPLFPLKQIKFLVNLDLLGTGDEGITVVNGSVFKNEFDILTKINEEKKYLSQIKIRGKAANSDHYFFTEAGVKSFFIYTLGGIKAYHDIYDRPETLPLTKFEDVFKLLVDFTEALSTKHE